MAGTHAMGESTHPLQRRWQGPMLWVKVHTRYSTGGRDHWCHDSISCESRGNVTNTNIWGTNIAGTYPHTYMFAPITVTKIGGHCGWKYYRETEDIYWVLQKAVI